MLGLKKLLRARPASPSTRELGVPFSLPQACSSASHIRAEHLWEAVRTSEKRLRHPSAWSQARGAQTIPTLASSDLPRASLASTSCGGPQDRPATRTQAQISHARSARQPTIFRPDLQKESHGTATFLLVPLRALFPRGEVPTLRAFVCVCALFSDKAVVPGDMLLHNELGKQL